MSNDDNKKMDDFSNQDVGNSGGKGLFLPTGTVTHNSHAKLNTL